MDVFVNSPSSGQYHVKLEESDKVNHVQNFVKRRLGIDENDQVVIDLNSDKPVGASERLKQLENGGVCYFYVARGRQGFRADRQKYQEHRLIYCLVTGGEKLSRLMFIAYGNIRTQPIEDLSKNTKMCIQELDCCKGEMHMRTIIQLALKSEHVDPKQTRGALIHVNTVFQRLKEHLSKLNKDVRLIYLIVRNINSCNDKADKCRKEIQRLENKAVEVDKKHMHQKRYAEELQMKVEKLFDTASSCQIKGDAAASEKILSVKKGTKDFLDKLIETILKDAETMLFTRSLFTGATTNENMDLSEARQSVKQFKTDVCNVQPLAYIVIQNGKECHKYCEEKNNRYKEQLPDLQKTQDEMEEKKRRIDARLAEINTEYSNLRGLEERLSKRRDELIEIRDTPLKFLWNIVVTCAAVVLAPFTAGLSLTLLGLLQRIDWNDLGSVSDALWEVRRNQRDNEDNKRSVFERIAQLNGERELPKETKTQTDEKIDKFKKSMAVLPKISSGVERVNGAVNEVVQAFDDFENEVTFSFDVEELLKAKSMFYQYRKGTRSLGDKIEYTKEEESLIFAAKLEYVDKHIINMLKVSRRLHKVLEDADKMIIDVQDDGRGVSLNIGTDLGQFQNRYHQDHVLSGSAKHTRVPERSAYNTEIQVLNKKASDLKRSLGEMHTCLELIDQILSLFAEKLRPLEDITTLYNKVLALLTELDISPYRKEFAAESRNDGGRKSVDETSSKEVSNTTPPGGEGNSLSTGVSGSTEGTEQPRDHVGDVQKMEKNIKEKLNEFINAVLDL